MKIWKIVAALAAAIGASPALAQEDTRPVEVMVLGTYHFSNPGRDVVNMQADDVLSERRQRDLEKLSAALAEFRPTRIMVERTGEAPQFIDTVYAGFTLAMLRENRNETVQIGYRLAHRLGLAQVYAIDEQPSEGEPNYFPFEQVAAFAAAHGKADFIQRNFAVAQRFAAELQASQATSSIPDILIKQNEENPEMIALYYRMLAIGDGNAQPGADLNAMWYLRNAKIFAKMMAVAQPGERVLVLFGAGHSYWLRHFARETPGYRSVDPLPYLRAAARN